MTKSVERDLTVSKFFWLKTVPATSGSRAKRSKTQKYMSTCMSLRTGRSNGLFEAGGKAYGCSAAGSDSAGPEPAQESGREVLEEIKADPALMSIPVVILTTSASEQDILRSYLHHANCFITKARRPGWVSDCGEEHR
jgi:hypothetical protein